MFKRHATPCLWVKTIVVSGRPIRFFSVGTIGQSFTKMLTSSPSHVIGVYGIEEFRRGKSSLLIPF